MLKKILNFLTHRLFITILMLLIQIIFIVFIVVKFEESFLELYILTQILGLIFVIKIINEAHTNPNYKLIWIIMIVIVPVFGTLTYMIIGNKNNKKVKRAINILSSKYEKYLKEEDYIKNEIKDINVYNQFSYINNVAKFPVYKNTETYYLKDGMEYYKKLLIELEKAEKFIFLEYFIISKGYMWNTILEILKRKVKDGVDVRVIYDDMGSILELPSKYYNELNSYGIKCCSFNKFVPILNARLNNRDHRKIVVIDGNIAFTGGINLADEYINIKKRFGDWKDNGIMLKGEAVYSFTVMFLSMWDYLYNIDEDFTKFRGYNIVKSDGFVVPYADSPLDYEDVSKNVYLNLINKAKKSIYITTPYLIIDNEIEDSLKRAAKSGIDVKIIVPGIADKKTVNEVTKAYYETLLQSNVKIYEYNGFIHAKTFIIDNELATVGTVNLDYRSLYLHFECGTLLYRTSCITEIKIDFLDTLLESREILVKDIKISIFTNLKRAILKLFAPLM